MLWALLIPILPMLVLYLFLGASAFTLVVTNGTLIAIVAGALLFVWILRKVM